MPDLRDSVHAELSFLLSPEGELGAVPEHLERFLDDLAVIKAAKAYRQLDQAVQPGNKAVVVTAGPPGAGKSRAMEAMGLSGYRLIDPDLAKDLLLRDAENHGLLEYRNKHVLVDGKPVSLRELASHVHRASNRVADVVRQVSLDMGENVILDGTLSWAPLPNLYVNELRGAGYDSLQVASVEAEVDVAKEGARVRWWAGRNSSDPMGGRFVPDSFIESCFLETGTSVCSRNAEVLAREAGARLGMGELRRYEYDPVVGGVRLISRVEFAG